MTKTATKFALPTLGETAAAVGGLSKPSKMPWYGWGTPAASCKTGSRLREVPGSVCHGCYAHKGHYAYPNVQTALEGRLAIMLEDPKGWARAMLAAILVRAGRFVPRPEDPWPAFRWHDSGDLQSVEHLRAINWVALGTQKVPYRVGRGPVKHYLPTREYGIVEAFLADEARSPNLFVRLSAHMIDGPPPAALARKLGVTVATVHRTKASYPEATFCPAYDGDGTCGSCRSCWGDEKFHVSYPKH